MKRKTPILLLGSEYVNSGHLAEEIIYRLDTAGLSPYIYHEATTGSIYIKFKDEQEFLGSLRVSDHEGISKYKYKLNLRSDIKKSYIETDKYTTRRYWSFSEFDSMVEYLRQAASITKSDNDYSYLLQS